VKLNRFLLDPTFRGNCFIGSAFQDQLENLHFEDLSRQVPRLP
jgi:hypothetical protein